MPPNAPWRDAEILNEMYNGKSMTQKEIAEEFGIDHRTVSKWMRKLDVKRRPRSLRSSRSKNPLTLQTTRRGYEVFKTREDMKTIRISHHRLLAAAEYGLNSIRGKVVHHKNKIPWDNRPENLKLMNDREHKQLHANNRVKDDVGRWVTKPGAADYEVV